MTSIRLRRSSLSIAKNIGSGLSSLKETLTSSMQDISEGRSSSTFYLSDSENMRENESDDNTDNVDYEEPTIKLTLSSNDINVEMIDYYLIFHLVKESHREAVLTIPARKFINSKADYLQFYCKSSYKRVSQIN